MADKQPTEYDKVVERLKNRRAVVWVLISFGLVLAVGQLAGVFQTVKKAITENPAEIPKKIENFPCQYLLLPAAFKDDSPMGPGYDDYVTVTMRLMNSQLGEQYTDTLVGVEARHASVAVIKDFEQGPLKVRAVVGIALLKRTQPGDYNYPLHPSSEGEFDIEFDKASHYLLGPWNQDRPPLFRVGKVSEG